MTRKRSAMAEAASGRDGFTLLEIILALGILAGGVAVLGEAVRLAQRNAVMSRMLTQAELLATSKMAELTSGLASLESASATPVDSDPSWLCAVSVEPLNRLNLLVVRVTISQAESADNRPVEYLLERWIADPAAAKSDANAEEEEPVEEEGETPTDAEQIP